MLVVVIIGHKALGAYLFGQSVYGEVTQHNVDISRERNFDTSQRAVHLHRIQSTYLVNEKQYSITVNSHVYSATGMIKKGDKLLIAFDPNHPSKGYVISYGLFEPIVGILVPLIALIFLIVGPQWLYVYLKSKKSA